MKNILKNNKVKMILLFLIVILSFSLIMNYYINHNATNSLVYKLLEVKNNSSTISSDIITDFLNTFITIFIKLPALLVSGSLSLLYMLDIKFNLLKKNYE